MRKDSLKRAVRTGPSGVSQKAKKGTPKARTAHTVAKALRPPELERYILDSSPDMIIAVDLDRRIIEFNRAAEKIFGYDADEVIGKSVDLLYRHPEEGRKVNEAVFLNGGYTGEITNKRKDGTAFNTFITASPLYDYKKRIIGVVGRSQDITDFKMAGDALKESERFLATIFDSINDPFSIIDREYRIVRANEAYSQMRSKTVGEVLGEHCYKIFQDRTDVCPDCVVKKTFDSADPCAKDKLLFLPNGGEMWVEIYTYPIRNEEGRVSHVIEYTRDITGRKRSEVERKRLIERLEYLSSTDVLTGLLNRRALIERLNYESDRAKRYGSELSLILCDIDSFKEINDKYGHSGGDIVLQEIAQILRKSMRKTDIFGRYGGDEFMLILPGTSLEGGREFAERVRLSVENKKILNTDGSSIKVTLSVGVSTFDRSSQDFNLDSLIKRGDTALYTSKRTGKNKVSINS